MHISSEQIRAARSLLRLEQAELAQRANVSAVTVRRLEAPGGTARVADTTVQAVRSALEAAGVEFVDGGVRHRAAARQDAKTVYRRLRAIAEHSAAQFANLPPFSEDDLYDESGLPR